MTTSNSSPSIQGDAVPPPISDIAKLGLHQGLMTTARTRGLVSPMQLQKHIWPIVIRGRSVACVSKHNSGKTVGYVMPLLSCIMETHEQLRKEKTDQYGPIALILVPSPQAAESVGKICSLLLSSMTDVKCVVLHSDKSECEVYSQLLNGCSILVATPQSFLKALLVPQSHRHVFTNLRRTTHLVIDEAEVLLSKCNESVGKILAEVGSAMSVRKAEGSPSAGLQLIVMASDWTKEVEEFFGSMQSYQPILIKGAMEKGGKK